MSKHQFQRVLTAAVVALSLAAALSAPAANPDVRGPDDPETVTVKSGSLELRALIWRPSGSGPFPAVVFSHGSYSSNDPTPADGRGDPG